MEMYEWAREERNKREEYSPIDTSKVQATRI